MSKVSVVKPEMVVYLTVVLRLQSFKLRDEAINFDKFVKKDEKVLDKWFG